MLPARETSKLTKNPVDKAKLISILTQTLTNGSLGVKKTPGVCGGDACVGNTRIQVWVLVGYRRLGCSDAELLKCYPHLTAADLVNAWAYADAYPDEIETAIARNEAA
ncbi:MULTISPECIES: DUF433 domain-containing protein [unclassified Microcoleus]|uniref:DUF433 domain-containing protein n=1 Tax=unclassified Microcoleus TaxID=2642155 RepID=UPI001DB414A3|nr:MULTISPECIES: DUF433 domain-containing protein [unclassified Microcoleus]MCC3419350.1 DUF433 domain-containing protein [Microcoleus sp. PH2017_07_MST_O_A]MCC3512842.1 DUF433 domain-containing protein [Microcoleus sp. PH2017_17_BER_D_A]TAE09793.1 MAG: DUF433 domain-containing protein [Oscillatoriales cyanobacterium]MCC3414595.1 DUF433 domain-containing protein [Microcoleus sp. PH2017_02_FOX_O_A]MCC3453806.1 DUF433 domain-containing protein [Microcoleus sp. PH2017_08_TRC_O_A]